MFAHVPALRVTAANDRPTRADGAHVLYWMTAARRTRSSFGLQHAMNQAARLGRPLIVLEALRIDYPWASARHHRFVVDGMRDQAARFDDTPIAYHPYVETAVGAGKGLVAALAEHAALVVTDEYPCFFLPAMVKALSQKVDVRVEQVDGNGILPLRSTDRVFQAAAHFRRFLQRELPIHLEAFPVEDPVVRAHELPVALVPPEIVARWPAAPVGHGQGHGFVEGLAIDQTVAPVRTQGGEVAGRAVLDRFVRAKLGLYQEGRNQPDQDIGSGLSPYLHFGHVSAHDVISRLFKRDGWSLSKLALKPTGSRDGWWGLSAESEAFIDELVTWRELGMNYSFLRPHEYDRWESLPEWARKTLDRHASDPREPSYDRPTLEAGLTHDRLWNAAQNQLRTEGRIHNYLRMLWGKKVLEWSATPRDAMATLVELNNRWALDGRDPNSYSGILWCFGRYDRPWGPERPIFGTVRYMSSAATAQKLRVKGYLERWAPVVSKGS